MRYIIIITAIFCFICSCSVEEGEGGRATIEGKVFVEFVVDKNGKVRNAKVLREPHAALGMEALRVINKIPDFIPGKQRGQNVNIKFTIPVNFVLN